MNQLVFIENNRPVTDSLTVAETFGKEHRRVLQDIREVLSQVSPEWGMHHFVQTLYRHEQNSQQYPKYLMTEQGFTLLVMGYTGQRAMEFKVKYIDEFNRMRNQLTQPQLPQNYKEALIALVGEVERREIAEEQVRLNAPKVALYDTAMSAGNNHTMERVSKMLGYGRNKLFQFLRDQKILRSNNLPYQTFIDRGYFAVRQYTVTHFTSGLENKTQTLVTPRGVAYIHKLLIKHGILKNEGA